VQSRPTVAGEYVCFRLSGERRCVHIREVDFEKTDVAGATPKVLARAKALREAASRDGSGDRDANTASRPSSGAAGRPRASEEQKVVLGERTAEAEAFLESLNRPQDAGEPSLGAEAPPAAAEDGVPGAVPPPPSIADGPGEGERAAGTPAEDLQPGRASAGGGILSLVLLVLALAAGMAALGGYAVIVVRAFGENLWWGLAGLLAPPSVLVFAHFHPKEVKAPLGFLLIGSAAGAACWIAYASSLVSF